MKLVLTENIRGLGRTGDIVTVKNGHGRNHLLPKGFGVAPTENNITRFQAARESYLVAEKDRIVDARNLAAKLTDLTLNLTMKANDAGHLFGSVNEAMIADGVLSAANVEIAPSMVVMGAHLKHVGEHAVALHLHSEVEVDLLVTVVAEESKPSAELEEDSSAEDASDTEEETAETAETEEEYSADSEPSED